MTFEATATAHPDWQSASDEQNGLWLLQETTEIGAAANRVLVVEAWDLLDADAVRQAVTVVMQHHPALRTEFDVVGGVLASRPRPEARADVAVRRTDSAEFEAVVDQLAHADLDPLSWPPFRLSLVEDGVRSAVVLVLHFAIADHAALPRLAQDLCHALVTGHQTPSPSSLETSRPTPDLHALARTMWEAEVDGAADWVRIPTLSDPTTSATGVTVRRFDEALRRHVERLAEDAKTTVETVLLAALQALQHRYSGTESSSVATAIELDARPEADPCAIGAFTHEVPLVSRISASTPFRELVRAIDQRRRELMAVRECSFAGVLRDLGRLHAARDLLPQVAARSGQGAGSMRFGSRELRWREFVPRGTRWPLAVSFLTSPAEWQAVWEHDPAHFSSGMRDQMAAHFETILRGAAVEPSAQVGSLRMMGRKETDVVVRGFNRTNIATPSDGQTVIELFESHVDTSGDRPALLPYAAQAMTYRDLDARANQLAHLLRRKGVRHGDVVAIAAARSTSFVATVLGTLKASAAYLPLDTGYPIDRLEFMLTDSGARCLVTEAEPAAVPLAFHGSVVHLDRNRAEIDASPATRSTAISEPDDLAYVMYTSGSTGRPKGVEITHRNIVRLVSAPSYAELGPRRRLLMLAPVSFDASTLEIWGALLHGGELSVAPDGPLSVEELGVVIGALRPDTVFITTALFHAVIDQNPSVLGGVDQILTGGEVLSVAHIRRALEALPRARFVNCYGPTECTTFTTAYPVPRQFPAASPRVPIGRPIQNTDVHILDGRSQPVPIGAPGELHVGGPGVARGYRGRAEQTAARFVANPFGPPDSRLYKTGDLARYLPDGVIDFLGRIDDQVKIRGHRIEPGEIEAALALHPAVAKTLVVADVSGTEKRLVAYCMLRGHASCEAAELRDFLGRSLPRYMIPAAVVVVDDFKLTPSGKVDRKALPRPVEKASGADGVAPRTDIERALAEIWMDVLGVEAVGADDNFFELGGHSLLAGVVADTARERFGCDVSLRMVFEHPTVAGMATAVRKTRSETATVIPRAPRRVLADADSRRCSGRESGQDEC